MVIITKHAKQRIKERMGLPKRSIQKLVQNAYDDGNQHSDFTGSFSRYLSAMYLKEKTANNIRVYNGNLFMFKGHLLLTMYEVPQIYRKASRVNDK